MEKSRVFDGLNAKEEEVNRIIDKRLQEITFREYEGRILTPW